jgi:glycosyltransferase involved in cell wall biosynthesis
MTIGRLDPVKSHELFVRAAAHVARHRTDVRFFVVGEGPLRSSLEAEIVRLGVGASVTLLGERTDISRLLGSTDVCVRPGIVEGFVGITVLEAQAFGVPVIAFETEDVKLAVTDHETGLLVPPNDTEALGAAVLELLGDPELAERLGAAGRSHLEATYALPVVVDALEALYAEHSSDPAR